MIKKIKIVNRFAVLFALILLFGVSISAQSKLSEKQIAEKVDEYMNAASRVDRFIGSVLVAKDGKPILIKGYGMANIELGVANSPQTVFRIGSITKQFTSMAIMILQERGKLSAGDPVCKYFENCPAAWQPLTLRHLLSHTSGITNYTNFPGFIKTAAIPTTTAEVIERFKDKPLEFTPGEKYAYSNSGYYLLGVIVEKVSGKSYADFLQENIFAPLGMKNTLYDDPARIIKNRADGYLLKGEDLTNSAPIDMSVAYAAGALMSTVEDMLIWDQALYTEKLVSRKTLDEIFTPVKGNYGYGWSIGKKGEHARIAHGGNIYGFSAYFARFPDDRLTIIVLSNNQSASGGEITDDLASIAFGDAYKIPQERKTIAVDPKILEKYVGVYQVTTTATITVTFENGKLYAELTNEPKWELFAESETVFFMKTLKGQITFVKNAEGAATELIFQFGTTKIPSKKVK